MFLTQKWWSTGQCFITYTSLLLPEKLIWDSADQTNWSVLGDERPRYLGKIL